MKNIYLIQEYKAEYGGAWELTKEEFFSGAAAFFVTWIIVYTGLHVDTL